MSSRPDCRVKLRQCLAIVVSKEGSLGTSGDFWMYESGYLLFQGLLNSNSVCWWNSALNGATKNLTYRGYVTPGAILVSAETCALEVIRSAWARRILQPPPGYQIVALEDVEDSIVTPVPQTQWTPLTEAICAVVLRLSSQGRPAGIPTIKEALIMTFPHISPPSERVIYDTLVQLMTEKKLYNTSRGYFIVTPERRRSRSHSRSKRRNEENSTKTMLMSTEEALVMVHGEMATVRDGDVTHQCIQTNLADVICGGNTSDKILYARNSKRRSASFPSPKSPDRRGSFRLWGSSRRLRRSASTRTLARHYVDSSSSTDYPNSSDSAHTPTPKKESLLSRIFRRSKRSQCHISSYSAQFPPTEWFNSKAIHLHNVGTQTSLAAEDVSLSASYCYINSDIVSSKSATLPRRHRRQLSNESNYNTSYMNSREQSPSLRYTTPPNSLPRNPSRSPFHTIKTRKSSRNSLTKTSNNIDEEDLKILETKPIQNEACAYFKPVKASSLESLKTTPSRTIFNDDTALKSLTLDNSGPSSIESHKSSKTGSSVTSGPSSIESHKTVIAKHDLKFKCNEKRKTAKSSNSFTLQVTTNQNSSSANAKIYVQNTPVRSVITFENGRNAESNVIINGEPTNNESTSLWTKNNNDNKELNNSRKLSLQTPSKDLNYKNYLKNVPSTSNNDEINHFKRNSFEGSMNKIFDEEDMYRRLADSKTSLDKSYQSILEKNILGSEPNITDSKVLTRQNSQHFNDLSFNFTSLAAQKILKGVSINSVDTLVELNMAASHIEKQNNCDVVHTDFGLV